MIDSLDGPPGVSALIEDDVIIAGVASAPLVIMRYSARGELLWRRSDAFAHPTEEIVVTLDPTIFVTQIATDSFGRVWALFYDDSVWGFVRLESTGRPVWRAWAFMTYGSCPYPLPSLIGSSGWVLDSQGRPVLAASALGLLRLESEAEGPAEERASLSIPLQEEFYSPCDVFGLDTDAQDRVYVATHEGPHSDERLRIDRISSDFDTRERYIPDLGDVVLPGQTFRGFQVTPGGDVYVLIQEFEHPAAFAGTRDELQRIHLARLQLGPPGAPSAGAAAR